jgi:hypothetical protein
LCRSGARLVGRRAHALSNLIERAFR